MKQVLVRLFLPCALLAVGVYGIYYPTQNLRYLSKSKDVELILLSIIAIGVVIYSRRTTSVK